MRWPHVDQSEVPHSFLTSARQFLPQILASGRDCPGVRQRRLSSEAPNLVPGDTIGAADVFVTPNPLAP